MASPFQEMTLKWGNRQDDLSSKGGEDYPFTSGVVSRFEHREPFACTNTKWLTYRQWNVDS
jgi:hypothetical protein